MLLLQKGFSKYLTVLRYLPCFSDFEKCSKNKFLFLRILFLFLDPSSLYQIVGNLTRNGVALYCFSKYFIVFNIFPCLDFLT